MEKVCVCVYEPHQVKINDGHFRFNLLLLLLLLYTWLVIISAVWLSINRPKFSRSLSSKKTKQQKHWKSEAHFSFRQTSSHQFRWSHEKRTPNTAYTQLCEMWMWKMAYLRIGYIGSLLTKYRTEQFFFLCGYFFNVGKWVDKMSQILCALFIFFLLDSYRHHRRHHHFSCSSSSLLLLMVIFFNKRLCRFRAA